MKKYFFIALVLILINCISCSYSKGVKKDISTGLTTAYNGFTIQDIYLTDADGNRLSSNSITLGSKIAVIASGVNNFVQKEGHVFPGCNIILTDKSNKEILNLPDAFADMPNGTTAAEATILKASLNTGDPMAVGSTYHLHIRFYDKKKAVMKLLQILICL
jgi:hypothetical protein